MERQNLQLPIPVAARSKAWGKHNGRMDWKQKETDRGTRIEIDNENYETWGRIYQHRIKILVQFKVQTSGRN